MTGVRRSNRPPKTEETLSFASEAPRLSAAWITRPRVGESVSGDAVFVRRRGDGVLITVIDALGHGPNANAVAEAATSWLGAAEEGPSITDVVQGLHRALQGSRGAAGLVFAASPKGIEACSVGNVALRSRTGKLPFVLTPGVFGLRLRQPRVCETRGPVVDRFVLFSDGISGRFDLQANASFSPSELAQHLFANHRHDHDDSTVVVVDVDV